MLALLFVLVVHGLNVPGGSEAVAPILEASTPAAPSESGLKPESELQLAGIGRFLAYRGYSLLAIVASWVITNVSLLFLWLFVRQGRARKFVVRAFAALLAVALVLTLAGGTAMGRLANKMTCGPNEAAKGWEFCSLAIGKGAVELGFNRWVEAACAAAAVAAVFAILVVAQSRTPGKLPAMLGNRERCVTILMVGASALLTVRLFLNDAFLHWAFQEYLAAEKPSRALTGYIAGTATFNASMETSLLALTWFAAIVLLQKSGTEEEGPPQQAGTAGSASFSVYNISAIFTPLLSAMANNLLSG